MRSAGARRINVSAARDVFLQNVVLNRSRKPREIGALLLRHGEIERQQNRGRGVDGHGGGDAFERNSLEEHFHVFQ